MEILDLSSIANTVSSYDSGSVSEAVSDREAVSIAMLDKALDMSEAMQMQMIKSMEMSVNPNLGANINMHI